MLLINYARFCLQLSALLCPVCTPLFCTILYKITLVFECRPIRTSVYFVVFECMRTIIIILLCACNLTCVVQFLQCTILYYTPVVAII